MLDDPRYAIDFCVWHKPRGGKVGVCLGGAVMAKRLGAEITWDTTPDYSFEDTRDALTALYH